MKIMMMFHLKPFKSIHLHVNHFLLCSGSTATNMQNPRLGDVPVLRKIPQGSHRAAPHPPLEFYQKLWSRQLHALSHRAAGRETKPAFAAYFSGARQLLDVLAVRVSMRR